MKNEKLISVALSSFFTALSSGAVADMWVDGHHVPTSSGSSYSVIGGQPNGVPPVVYRNGQLVNPQVIQSYRQNNSWAEINAGKNMINGREYNSDGTLKRNRLTRVTRQRVLYDVEDSLHYINDEDRKDKEKRTCRFDQPLKLQDRYGQKIEASYINYRDRDDVKLLQRILGAGVDGDCGSTTAGKVRDAFYDEKLSLGVTFDGVVNTVYGDTSDACLSPEYKNVYSVPGCPSR